ncbi:MAG: hypothetical protein ACK5VQ_10240 [Gammaproteobacteria bacterium]|jgi:hypothetical protein
MKASERAAPRAARMIAWTAAAALVCWGATLSMVRAVAQETAPPRTAPPDAPPDEPPTDATPADAVPTAPTTAGAPVVEDGDTNEEASSDRARAPVTLDELPEFRDSADNNITLPVDI